MSGRPRVLFAPAAAPEVGGGHLMRDLALSEALQACGADCTFATPPWGERLLRRFAETPVALHPLSRSGDVGEIAAAVRALAPDVLVLDDYGLSAIEVAPFAAPGLKIVVVDDLADRTYACDLLIDPGFGRTPRDYAGRVPPACELLLGPRYALLRPAFARTATTVVEPSAARVRRVFVSFGLSDVDAIASRAIEVLRPLAPDAVFDVALASDADSLPRLCVRAASDPGLVLHPDARDVAALMQAADIAVGAGGSATWERCALGLPTLAVVVADNQRDTILALSRAGALLHADTARPDFDRLLAQGFVRLCGLSVRRTLGQTARALCDGEGAGRVARAVLGLVGP